MNLDFQAQVMAKYDKAIHQSMNNSYVQEIINTVCDYYSIAEHNIKARCRKKEIILPRRTAMLIIREAYPHIPLMSIGRIFKQDHASVIHSVKKAKDDYMTNRMFREDMKKLAQKVGNERLFSVLSKLDHQIIA